MESDVQKASILPETPSTPVTIVFQRRVIEVYSVSNEELDILASGYNSLHFTFFGIALGAAIAFFIVLVTASLSETTGPIFVALFAVSLVLSVYFSIRAILDRQATAQRLKQIRQTRGP